MFHMTKYIGIVISLIVLLVSLILLIFVPKGFISTFFMNFGSILYEMGVFILLSSIVVLTFTLIIGLVRGFTSSIKGAIEFLLALILGTILTIMFSEILTEFIKIMA